MRWYASSRLARSRCTRKSHPRSGDGNHLCPDRRRRVGVRPEDVQVLHGDTAMLASGQGTFASRGMTLGGSAMYEGLQQARRKMALLAAHLLDCRPEDIVFQDGKLVNESRPEHALTFAEVAAAAQQREQLPPGTEPGLEFPVHFILRDNPFGFGAHVAVVEVDRDTGALNVLRYVAVHDCGRVINPKLLEGQVYGAIAQGLGQALGEGMRYSPEGQPLTGTLLDYPLPHAKDMLEIRTATRDPIANQSAALEGHWRAADRRLCRGHRQCGLRRPVRHQRAASRRAPERRKGMAGCAGESILTQASHAG